MRRSCGFTIASGTSSLTDFSPQCHNWREKSVKEEVPLAIAKLLDRLIHYLGGYSGADSSSRAIVSTEQSAEQRATRQATRPE